VEALRKIRQRFPANISIQCFRVNDGPLLKADGDTEFFSVKKVREAFDPVIAIADEALADWEKTNE